ncbi:alpha-amylase family glycosyl hydrolase [Geomicrobium sp. JCM 19039]|uniref:carbohydrate-binding module family 20 domain-containing protein n=1 Tax=Geomicrobium sp. JCM 19039 TaxID=1460636 RepID=UPI00045F46D0|nr:alpha-amylase family glycosyl hydrolase [Geomicrobium sp. JCM 19039]GAK10529.1 cyclomaltodextrin glucanotransferase [Geomicrobium sp. JCM 19039]
MDMKNELQNNGIKVVLDFVSNHTSRWQNPTIGNVPEDGQLFEPNRDENGRYMFDDDGEPTVVNGRTEQLLADPNGSLNANWFYRIGDRGNDESRYGFRYKDLGSLASFNHENPAVIQHLDDAVQFWVNTGIDGIRHDATLHLNPAFMKGFKQRIDSNNNGPITQFGEFFIGRPDQKYDEYVSFPDRTGVNNLDFEWYRASANTFGNFSESMSDFGDMLVKTEQDYSYENQAVTFLDNHDVTRFRYTQQNDRPYHAGIVALMTSRGIPNIYYGTEQYLDSDDASDIAGRVFMERETEFNENTVAFQTISSLAELRQQNPAIAYGLTNIRHSSEHVLVYERSFYDYTVVVAINRHPDEAFNVPSVPTQLPNDTYEDVLRGLLDGQSVEVSDGQLPSFELSGGASAVWSYNNHSSEQPMIGDVISTMGVAGDRVHLYGENLSEASVWFGDVEAEVIDRGDQELVTLVPTGLDAGDVSITLQSGATTSNAFTFHKLSGEQTQVVFNIEANTNFGETIHVVGNIPELGSWDADRSTEAFLNPEHPYWFLPVSVPINEEIEYKFIKKNEQGDVIWESGTNRTLDTPSNFSDVKFTETDVFQN